MVKTNEGRMKVYHEAEKGIVQLRRVNERSFKIKDLNTFLTE
jgi:hypothetical protein